MPLGKGHLDGNDIASRIKGDEALLLRIKGLTFENIAVELGYRSKNHAYVAVKSSLARHNRKLSLDVDHWRTIEILRLEQLHAALWSNALKGDLRSVDRILAISAARSRIIGTDAPTKIEADVTHWKASTERLEQLSTEQLEQLQAILKPVEILAPVAMPTWVEGEIVGEG